MFNLLELIKKNLIISILIGMVLGIIIGNSFDVSWFAHLILPLTFMLVYPMMVTLKFSSLKEKSNIKLQIVTQIINFIVFPLIAFLIGHLFFYSSPFLRLGLLLISLLPTSGMTISWTVMAKGNINAAIKMVIIGLVLGAILTPFYITLFLGAEVDVPVSKIITQVLIVVFLPLVVAYITQTVLIKKYTSEVFHKKIKPKFPLFSTLGVVLMIFVAIALKSSILISNPLILIEILIPIIFLYLAYSVISILTARLFFNREDGIALVNGTLIRNLSLALVIVLSAFPDAGITALLIAIAYILQVQIAAWNVKLTSIIFK